MDRLFGEINMDNSSWYFNVVFSILEGRNYMRLYVHLCAFSAYLCATIKGYKKTLKTSKFIKMNNYTSCHELASPPA